MISRHRSLERDPRTQVLLRITGIAAFSLLRWGHVLRAAHAGMLVGAVVGGALVQVVGFRAAPGRFRESVFEAGLWLDLVVLAFILHLTGGPRSPLLPLAVTWAALGIVSHGELGALAYTAGVLACVGLQEFTFGGLWDAPHVVPEASALLVITLIVVVGTAAAAWRFSRVVNHYQRVLAEASLRDHLTGLWNRRAFDARLREMAALATRLDEIFSVALIDLDHFKDVNDRAGHKSGDGALRHFAGLLSTGARAGDEVFRVGGEEFVMLLPFTDADGACAALRRLRASLASSPPPTGPLSFSAGIATGREVQLLEEADFRMYEAKRAGRDAIFGPDGRMRLTAEGPAALESASPKVGTFGLLPAVDLP